MALIDNEVLEFQTLKRKVAKFADSPEGAQLIEQLAPFQAPAEIQRQFAVIQECVQFLSSGERVRFGALIDYSLLFEKATIDGNCLTTGEILQILNLCLCSQSTRKHLRGLEAEFPLLKDLASELPSLDDLVKLISGKIDPSGEVLDHASPVLRRLRSESGILRNRLYESLEKMFQREASAELMQDEVITIRNERFVIPVRYEKRRELPGVVHGTSSSGSTLFVEPLETIDMNNQLVRLKEQTEAEIQRILLGFTEKIGESLPELRHALRLLGYLDSQFARARFSEKFRAVIPEINETGTLTLVDGRHPLLEDALAAQGKTIVPISINLDGVRHILIISGPNTGGKTVALKTIGLLTLMALSAIPVPASSASVCVFHQVLADIGDRQSIAENLSTFSSHLLNIREILETVTQPALVLLDELGTGTDPTEGSALGIAIVEQLRRRGITVVATTHHNGLKIYASQTERVANASVEFDLQTLQPTYRLIHGVPGSSSGLEIAHRLGLGSGLIEHARQLVPQEEQELASFSRFLREQIDQATRERERLQQEQRELEKQRRQLEAKYLQQAEHLRKEQEQNWQRASQLFETETRKLMAEIKDKYLQVRARREIDRKSSRLRQQAQQELVSPAASSEASAPPAAATPATNLVVGARVRVRRFGQEGTVLAALKEGEWEVAVGNLKCVVRSEDLEPTGQMAASQPIKPLRITVEMHSPELQSNDINLIGCTVDEAVRQVERFLDKAYLASIPTVRLIHGAGMGILKRALAEWLATQPLVDKFHAAAPDQGGNAITIVSLKL